MGPAIVSVGDQWFRDVLAKHAAFWQRREGSLLRSAGIFASSAPVRLPQPDGSIITRAEPLQPDMIHADLLVREAAEWPLERLDWSLPLQGQFFISPGLGDTLPLSHTMSKVPWLEAMLGCPVHMTDGQIWSVPYPGDAEDIIRRGANFEHNAWFQLYLEFLRELKERVGGRFPVSANTLFRGTCDLVAAVLGVTEACIGWLDNPRLMARLMRVCTDANLAVIEAGNKIVEPFMGGYLSSYALWAPGPVLRTQADHSTLLSPRVYQEQILPFDVEVIRSCPCSVFHLHNPGLHVAPLLVQVPELSAIEIVVDPYPTDERKPYEVRMMQMIQEHKPLILDVNFPSAAEADWLLAQLSPRGLCFNARFSEATFAALPAEYPGRRVWLLA